MGQTKNKKPKRIGTIKDGSVGKHRYFFECPGCGYAHCFTADEKEYDGNAEFPLVSKTIVIPGDIALFHCESNISGSLIIFKHSCTHDKAGQTHNLPYIK